MLFPLIPAQTGIRRSSARSRGRVDERNIESSMQQPSAERGPLVWRDMDQKTLDDAYNQAAYAPNMALVTVNLNWTNFNHGTAIPHSRQMQTQVARYGLQSYIWGAVR